MKLSKDVIQISTTAIVTSAIFILSNLFFGGSRTTMAFVKSEVIDWPTAEKLKGEYIKFKPLRVKHKGESGTATEKKENLQGFVFDAIHLDSIINHNHDPLGKPDKVIFYLGQDGTFYDGGFGNAGIIHIIALGMKGKVLMNRVTVIGGTRKAALIYDKADPCPPFCP